MTNITSEFDLLIIYPNDIIINADNFNNLTDEITKYIQKIGTTIDDLMYVLYDLLNMSPDIVGDSDIVYENDTLIYQLFHNSENWVKTEDECKLAKSGCSNIAKNSIATYLVNTEKKINGVAVLLCSRIKEDYLCTVNSVNINDLINIMSKTFFHCGNIVHTNNTITTFNYIEPLDNIINKQNYTYVETYIYNFHFIGCYDTSIQNAFNAKASLLFDTIIHGDIRVCLVSNTSFIDLESNLLNSLLFCLINSKERKYNNDEDLPEKCNGLQVIKNNYTLLKRKITNHKIVCCNPDCDKLCDFDHHSVDSYAFKCDFCYKVFYHNLECQKSCNETHKEICLILNQ